MELHFVRDYLFPNWGKIWLALVVVAISLRVYRHFSALILHLKHLPTVEHPVRHYLLMLSHCYKTRVFIPPLVGIFEMACAICSVFTKQKICCVWVAYRPLIVFYKPETVEVILNSNNTIDKSHEYKLLHPWLGTGLLTSTGDKWRTRRKLLTPSFHFRILEDFTPVYNEQAQILIKKMKTMATKEWIDIVPLVTMCALEIISETTMGVRLNAQEVTDSEYASAIYEVGDIFIYRALRPWLWNDTLFGLFPSGRHFKKKVKILHDFTRKVIKEKKKIILKKRAENAENGETERRLSGLDEDLMHVPKKRRALLELLLEHHLNDGSLTEEDIREEVDTFMFEGHDTTAMAICWTLYNLGLRPDIQEKVLTELDSIFDDDVDRPVTSDDMKAMKYLECVIKESLRLYPSVPFIARELRSEIKVLDYTIPPGAMCFIFLYMLHRDPESFPNPEYFDPDRFSPENSAGRHPYAYVPFSAGPRNCIGQRFAIMEEKTVLAHILRNFKVKSLDHRDRVQLIPDLILRNVDPVRLKLIPRYQ